MPHTAHSAVWPDFLHLQLTDLGYSCVQKDAPAAGICLASALKHCCKHEGALHAYFFWRLTPPLHDQTINTEQAFIIN